MKKEKKIKLNMSKRKLATKVFARHYQNEDNILRQAYKSAKSKVDYMYSMAHEKMRGVVESHYPNEDIEGLSIYQKKYDLSIVRPDACFNVRNRTGKTQTNWRGEQEEVFEDTHVDFNLFGSTHGNNYRDYGNHKGNFAFAYYHDYLKQKNLPSKSKAEAKSRGLKTFMGMDKSGMRTKELAAVTREDLTKVGLDPSKKSSLTKYLNMRNKTGKTPTKSDFAPKSNLLGDAMKKQDTKKIQKNIQAGRKKDISSARKADSDDPSYNVKKLKRTPPPKGGTSTYNKGPNSNDPSYNTKKMKTPRRITTTSRYNRKPNVNRASYNRGGFIKIGDGDKIVRRAYGGKVGK